MGKLRAWIATLTVAGVVLGVSAATASAVPKTFWGVVPQATPTAEQFQRLKRGKVGSIRLPLAWAALQTEPGAEPGWAPVDAVVEGAARAGIDVLPFVYGAPPWAVAVDNSISSHPPVTLPVRTGGQRSAWTSFLRLAVERYGPGGKFWSEHPGVPVRPIHSWQVWNEPNFFYFVARPNPVDYAKLVQISASTIHSVDPAAEVILAGMFARPAQATWKRKPPLAYFATDFLRQMLKSKPSLKNQFDAVALHPYTREWQSIGPEVEELRAVLKAAHDPAEPLWVTELGWSSKSGSRANFSVGPQGQARELTGAFKLLRDKRSKWRIGRVYWFSVDDQKGVCNFCDGSGLFGPGFKPKPSWKAFVKLTGGVY